MDDRQYLFKVDLSESFEALELLLRALNLFVELLNNLHIEFVVEL